MKASMAFDQKKTELVDELSKKEVRVRTVSQLPPVFHSSHFLISVFRKCIRESEYNIPNLFKNLTTHNADISP